MEGRGYHGGGEEDATFLLKRALSLAFPVLFSSTVNHGAASGRRSGRQWPQSAAPGEDERPPLGTQGWWH